MATRTQTAEPFKSGQSSNEHKEKPTKVKVMANTSQDPSADPATGIDHLRVALGVRNQVLPADNHIWTHTTRVEPVGAHYQPRGEFGHVTPKHAPNSTYTYGGAPNRKGSNAVGNNSNRKGEGALGKAMNRVGTNAVGKNSGRKGSNAVGSNSHRTGAKSGYPRFVPRGGGKNV